MKLSTTLVLVSVFAVIVPLHAGDGAPFNGSDLKGWKTKAKPKGKNSWVVGSPSISAENSKTLVTGKAEDGAAMVNVVSGHGQGWDIYTEARWGGTFRIEIELMVPQGANSGIYVMGEYEVQVLDSWGKEKLGGGDMGAIYGAQPPKLNASKKPGEWQKYVIDFQAPVFDASGKKTANARFIKVELNGKILHENVEMKGPTPAGVTGKEAPEGPIMFQGDHGPVAFRSLKISPIKL